MHTRFRMAYSAFCTSAATPSLRLQPKSLPPSMVLMVETSKRQCACSTSSSPTQLLRRILAKDSLRRIKAQSWRTVTGKGLLLLCNFFCQTDLCRSLTQMFCSFYAALGERRGCTFVLAYLIYFLSRSQGMAVSLLFVDFPWWISRMCEAIFSFIQGLLTSRTMKMQSKRDKMVLLSYICSSNIFRSSNLPNMGLAAAKTDVLELSLVVIPALATLMVCCSMASWMATLSPGFILSNSSMQTIPPSARTSAPPSIWNSPVLASLVMEAVSPAAEDPLPEVQTAMAAVCSTNLRNCDLAVEGSPMSRMLMSPRRMVSSGRCLREPLNSMQAMAFLISSLPQIPGAMEWFILSMRAGSLAIDLNCYSSCSLQLMSVRSFIFWMPVTQRQPFESISPFTSFTSITPVTLTRSPGTHLDTFRRSTTMLYVRATSPVGIQSGNYCMRID